MASNTFSVVDYEAWRKGYQPPGEHVLIDALSYRGAEVVASSGPGGWWLVMNGKTNRKKLAAICKQIHLMMEFLEEDEKDAAKAAAPMPMPAAAYGDKQCGSS